MNSDQSTHSELTVDGQYETTVTIPAASESLEVTDEVVYSILEGADSSISENSDETITVRVDGDFSKFTSVKVDGSIIDADNYSPYLRYQKGL